MSAGQSPIQAELGRAVEAADLRLVRSLIEHGAFIGSEILALAIRTGRSDLVEILLDAGADPSAPDHLGVVPIFVAAAAGHPALGAFLADPEHADPSTWPSHAITPGHGEILWMLLDRGAAANARVPPRTTPTLAGLTPLMVAAAFGNTPAINVLVARGSNSRALDAAGRSARDWADRMDQRAAAERLKSLGKR